MSAMDFLHQIRLGSYQLALSVPGILKLCNYLQNVAAITYIFGLQLSTFLFYNKHFGRQVNGWFLCIPNHRIGVELAHPSDRFWNQGSLEEAGMATEEASTIAYVLKELSQYI